MKKRFLFVLFCSVFIIESFSQDNKSIEKFIKGNISDKTAALREAEGNESVWLSNQAITFVLQSHELLGKDSEIDALAVAAILSMPNEYVSKSSDTARTYLLFWLNGDIEGANAYLEIFCKKSDTPKQYVQKWIPIVAASQSVKGHEEEKELLHTWLDVVEYE